MLNRVKEENSQLDDEQADALAIKLIKEQDLLKKKEGKAFKESVKAYSKVYRQDVNLTRRKIGMVFQQFNLFNNLTVMQNLTLAPVQLKLKTKEQAEAKGLELLKRIGLKEFLSKVL